MSYLQLSFKYNLVLQGGQVERMNGLNYLVTRGIDRTAPEFQVVKPLLHAMCIKREEEATFSKGQGDNMGSYVKDSEFASVNGKYLNDCMTPHDVALLILVIENNITKSDIVSKPQQLSLFLLSNAILTTNGEEIYLKIRFTYFVSDKEDVYFGEL